MAARRRLVGEGRAKGSAPLAVGVGLWAMWGCFVFTPGSETAWAQSNAQEAQRPTGLSFDQTRIHLGRVETGKKISCSFAFRNDSAETVRIYSVRASCGCTAVNPGPSEIAPVARGQIEVTYQASRLGGPFEHQVPLETRGGGNQTYRVAIFGENYCPVTVLPRTVAFGPVPRGETPERLLTLYSPEGLKFRIVRASVSSLFSVPENPAHGELKTMHTLPIRVGKETPVGDYDKTLSVTCDFGGVREEVVLEIPIRGTVKPDWAVEPSSVSFGFVKSGASYERTARIRAGNPEFRVTEVFTDAEQEIACDLRPGSDGSQYDLRVKLTPPGTPCELRASIVLRTTSRDLPTLELPVYAIVK